MKLLVLTAIIAAVTSSPLTENNQWPWQVGKEYIYNVDSLTWTEFEKSNGNGNAFKTQFIVRVLEPGRLVAKLESPSYAQVQVKISRDAMPSGLTYNPIHDIDHPFEIFVDKGNVVSLKLATTLTVKYENLLKGLISALQVNVNMLKPTDGTQIDYDRDFQGTYQIMEADVTGVCETLYTYSPVSAEWHRELPQFVEDPIEITKSKNYGSCQKNIGYHFGLPEGAVWKGIAYSNEERQFIKHTSESRMLVSKKGTIYKSETLSSVFANPLLFGKQKVEVYSYVSLLLQSVQPESSNEWRKTIEFRTVDSLLFSFNETAFVKGEKNIADAQKLVQEITPLLKNLNNLSKADFLMKFNLLVRSIMFMSSEQLTHLTSSIEIAKSSKSSAKNNMWIIYRDAVAQAGTIAAFKEIKAWILTKKIEGLEAAEIISSMASILRFPTKDVMNEFYDFAWSPEVREQNFLNTTALLAVTKFISSSNDDLFIEEKVIPRLSQGLKQAIEKGDRIKAQVYVRVLGNLVHPSILKVFAPYLDGTVPVSKYLRIQIVISLKTLANSRNDNVRAVLFSILKNTAEPYEVRVAAALNIFLAFPSHDMMQIMAHMALKDPSTQVRAVLANGITFAAGLEDPRFSKLAKTAKSLLYMIPKEKFGYRYSTDSLIDDYTSDDELSHFREISYIGSENNILPKYYRAALRFRNTGWTEEDWYSLSVSDVQQLLDFITSLFVKFDKKPNEDFKFSANKIAELLNIKREKRDDLEGSFFLNSWNQQMLWTFNDDDVYSMIKSYSKQMESLFNGFNYNYIKILSQKQVFVTFPLAAGVPFVLDYSEPTAVVIQSKSKVKFGNENLTASSDDDVEFTYARNLDGGIGFFDTLGDVYAVAGVVNKLQFYVPLKLSLSYTAGEIKINYKFPEQNSNLIHMSVWPYITLQKADSLLTVSENPLTTLIERSAKTVANDFKFGQKTGTVFEFDGYSFSSDYKNLKNLYDFNILANIRDLMYQKDIALTRFDLKYLAKESQNKAVTYSAFFDVRQLKETQEEERTDEMGPAASINDVTPNSKARREEIIKRAAAAIEYPKVKLVDISTVFDGQQKVEYLFTGALASSHVDNKVQAAVFFNGFEQINAVFKMKTPKIIPLNFEEAIKNKIKVEYEADFKFGNTDNIHLQGYGERSERYTKKLLEDPLAKQCLEEVSKHNFYQRACYKMIIKAHAPDFFKAKLTYKDTSETSVMIKNVYDIYENMYNGNVKQVDLFTKAKNATLEIEAQADYYDNYINYILTSQYGKVFVTNVEIMPYYPYFMSLYTPVNSWERTRDWYSGYQHMPVCAVDDNKIWTFSGRSYDYNLTGSWHVVMLDEVSEYADLLILARRPSENQAEVYLSYQTKSGKNLEIQLTSKTIGVISNANQTNEDYVDVYYDEITNTPLLEYFTIAETTELYSINNGAIRIIFDTHRLIIFSDDHRSTTRGICGQSSFLISDDYMTPYGLVDRPDLYGASFSLDDLGEYADSQTKELKKEAKLKAYQPVTKYTNILRSDAEWSKAVNKSVKSL